MSNPLRIRHLTTVVLAAVALIFVGTNKPRLTGSPAFPGTETPPDSAPRAESSKPGRTGRHLGFDTYSYPGHDVMLAWREDEVPYEWVGYYLPAPCHKERSWMGTRDTLTKMGWGIAVIYVGQQTWSQVPTGYETRYRTERRTQLVTKQVKVYHRVGDKRVARYVQRKVWTTRNVPVPYRVKVDISARSMSDCNAQLVSAERGTREAADAIQRTADEGFPEGTVIFLDIEHMDATPERMREYYRAWTRHLLEDGRYRPGYYVHTSNAELIYRDVKEEYALAGRAEDPAFWIAGGRDFTPDRKPEDVGNAFAAMWQGVLDVVQEWRGYKLPLDVSVSEVPSPSLRYIGIE